MEDRMTDHAASLSVEVLPGEALPPGASWDGQGTNFPLFSEHAESVELCLFDDDGAEKRLALSENTAFHWHGYLPGIGPEQRYGYRVHGRWAPHDGHRFNPDKLLIDPYALAIDGTVDWSAANIHPYPVTGEDGADLVRDEEDDAAAIPKSVVVDPAFDWKGDERPGRSWNETVIYEVHVKGFTERMSTHHEPVTFTSRRPQAKRAGPPNCPPSLSSGPSRACCPAATRWNSPTGRWSFSDAAKRAACRVRPRQLRQPQPELGPRVDRYEHQVALFLALEGVADQPDQRWPQANEQGPALGVAALVLVDRLGADPQRDAEPNGTE
jgi:hypothetical protein